MTDDTNEPWVYESYYYGNSVWPSDANWRIRGEVKEQFLMLGVYRSTLEECLAEWKKYRDERSGEPLVRHDEPYDGKERYALGWWQGYTPEAAEAGYADTKRIAWGEPSAQDHSEGWVPIKH